MCVCLSFYFTLDISEAKIHFFPSLRYDFHNNYCLKKKKMDMKSPLKKLFVTPVPRRLALPHSLYGFRAAETIMVTGNPAPL